jgi:hypothetical protein
LVSIGEEGLRVDSEAREANESNNYTEQVAIGGAMILRLANLVKPKISEQAAESY